MGAGAGVGEIYSENNAVFYLTHFLNSCKTPDVRCSLTS